MDQEIQVTLKIGFSADAELNKRELSYNVEQYVKAAIEFASSDSLQFNGILKVLSIDEENEIYNTEK